MSMAPSYDAVSYDDAQPVAGGDLSSIKVDSPDWLTFIEGNPEASIFHHPAWLSVLEACYGYRPFIMGLSGADGSILAGIPMMEVKVPFKSRRWLALPFSDYCPPLALNDTYRAALIDGLAKLSRQQGNPPIEVRWNLEEHPSFHSDQHHVLHILPLQPDAEAVAAGFHKMHQRNIDAAAKHGVRTEIRFDRDAVDMYYRLHLETRRRQGVPIQPRKFFNLLSQHCIEKRLGFVILAYAEEECIAGAFYLMWGSTLTYKYGASSTAGWKLRPNNLLFWEAIRWGCENGYTSLDLGKTSLDNDGLRTFKSRWGANETPLYYSSTDEQSSDGSAVDRLTPLVSAVIARSPQFVCQLSGAFYRYFT
jgi:hypothetical protein